MTATKVGQTTHNRCILQQVFQIVQVLGTADRPLVGLEVLQTDNTHFHAVDDNHRPLGMALPKIDAGDPGQEVDLQRRHPQSDYPVLSQKRIL